MNTSKNKNFSFELFTKENAETFLSKREGEKRIGEVVTENKVNSSKFVLFGIEESIGPIANNGFSGSENAWSAFLSNFLNTQVHQRFLAEDLAILGSIKYLGKEMHAENARIMVEELDLFVGEILNKYLRAEQIPIVIGGGHNNALPLMHWAAQTNKLSVVNVDPHADCRKVEGRHSGNSFSIALSEKTIENYAVLGLHEAYNNQYILDFLKANNCFQSFYEEYLQGRGDLKADFQQLVKRFASVGKIGIEIDMDAIAFMPSSAYSPSGFSVDEIRSLCLELSQNRAEISYVHFPEAAPKTNLEKRIVGKTLTYFVRDFMRII
jgi:formiminoglutamase